MIGHELYSEIRTEDIPDAHPEHDESYGYEHLVLYDSTIAKIGRLMVPSQTVDDMLNAGQNSSIWSLTDQDRQPHYDVLKTFTEVTGKHYRSRFGTDCINIVDHYGVVGNVPLDDTWVRPQAGYQTPTGRSYVATMGSRALDFAIGKFPAGIYLESDEVIAYRNRVVPVLPGEIICYDQHALVRPPQYPHHERRYPYVLLSASYDLPKRAG